MRSSNWAAAAHDRRPEGACGCEEEHRSTGIDDREPRPIDSPAAFAHPQTADINPAELRKLHEVGDLPCNAGRPAAPRISDSPLGTSTGLASRQHTASGAVMPVFSEGFDNPVTERKNNLAVWKGNGPPAK